MPGFGSVGPSLRAASADDGKSAARDAGRVLPNPLGSVCGYDSGRRLSHGCRLWLLAADRGGWHCLATVSAVWDDVGRRRSRHQHSGTTWLAVDRGELLITDGLPGAVHRRKMALAIASVCWRGDGGCACGQSKVLRLTRDDDLAV